MPECHCNGMNFLYNKWVFTGECRCRMPEHYEYEVQGNYGQGWEMVTTEAIKHTADMVKEQYDREEPQYPHRVKRVKVTES